MPERNTTLSLTADAQHSLAVTLRTLRQLEDQLYATGLTKVQHSLLGHMSHHRRLLWAWVDEETATATRASGAEPVAEKSVAEKMAESRAFELNHIASVASYLRGGLDALDLLAKHQATAAEPTPATTAAYLQGLTDAFKLLEQEQTDDQEDAADQEDTALTAHQKQLIELTIGDVRHQVKHLQRTGLTAEQEHCADSIVQHVADLGESFLL